MKTKVLLVYPEIPATYWSFKYALPFIGCKSSMPPLGLLTVAALLPENYEAKLIDMHVKKLNKEDIADCDLVFLSAMIVQKESFKRVVEMCRELGKTVVAGGPYPTTSYQEINGVDHFVLNEAEITLPEFLNDYERGNPRRIYTSERKPDIALTPPPRYDLIENVYDYTYLALQYSRGCPFNCEFCDIIEMLGRIHRSKTVGQFLNEMQCVYDTGFRGSLFIVDDNFIGNKNKVKKLLRGILEWQKEHDYPFILFTEASINLAQDDELLDLMFESGFSSVFIGIETPDANTLASAQKHQNLRDDLLSSIKKIQTRGLEVMGGFIVGFDTDPEDIFDRQIDFIQKAGIPTAMFGILQALPNTQLHRRLKEEGRLTGAMNGNNTFDLQLNFVPKMPKEKLINGYKRVISEIFKPGAYFKRSLLLLNRLPVRRKGNKPVDKTDIKAFFLSLLKQAFSNYGFIYIKYLVSILLRRPGLFPLAINFAVKGHHFFKMTERLLKAEEFSAALDGYLHRINNKLVKIDFRNNITVIIAEMERYRYILKKKTIKKYRQMNYSLHHLLEEKLAMIDEYCNSMISNYKKNSYLQRKDISQG
jgi:radical SAM superfamily enzyme YgiQ (UPF0313 family)